MSNNSIKKLVGITLAVLLVSGMVSCNKKVVNPTEKQDNAPVQKQEQTDNNTPADKTVSEDKNNGETGKGGITVKKADYPITLIKSIKANVRTDTPATSDYVNAFLKSFKEGNIDDITEKIRCEQTGVAQLLGSVKIDEYYVLAFDFPQSTVSEFEKQGKSVNSSDKYLVSLTISESDAENFKTGTSYYYIGADAEGYSGVINAFVPFENAQNEYLFNQEQTDYEYFINQISPLYTDSLAAGKYSADSISMSGHKHLVTHLMATFTDTTPPYSFNEVNSFIAKAFDGNPGITAKDIDLWSSSYANAVDSDLSDLYTNMDKKALGCYYAHGGVWDIYSITKTESTNTGLTVTCDYFADFAKMTKSKTIVYHFDNNKNGFPSLLGVEVKDVTGLVTASDSV